MSLNLTVTTCGVCRFSDLDESGSSLHFCNLMPGSPYTIQDHVDEETRSPDCPVEKHGKVTFTIEGE